METSSEKRFNIDDYSGENMSINSVDEYVSYAENLFHDVHLWLKDNKAELLK